MAAYLRVSSAGQDAQSQRAALERAAAARGDQIGEWYAEKQSGRALARPELARLRADVRAGRVRRLYVFRLDRLTRTGIRDTLALLDELKAGGCRVTTIADGFDVDGPAADVVCSVLAWVAEMERAALLERMAAARARVEALGGRWGRPARVDATTAKRLRAEAATGASVRELAVRFHVPRSVVARVVGRKGAYQKP